MSLFTAIDVAGSALDAQTIRLNTITSNLANASAVSDSPDDVYRARYPVFETVYDEALGAGGAGPGAAVRVREVVTSAVEARQEYSPGHPLADENGFIYRPAVDSVEEFANMIEASRSYQSSIEAMNTAKQLILRTLTLGR